jgi:hypothetical protein
VLVLAKQGYTADEIAAVYRSAAKPDRPEAVRDDDIPASLAMDYCGSPAEILAAKDAAK